MLRPRVGARWLAIATALLIAGGVVTGDRNPALASAESARAGTPVPATLAGTYRVEIVGSQGRFNGDPYRSEDTVRWYAITSSCAPVGCTAMATQLSEADPATPHPRGRVFPLHLQHDHWVTEPLTDASPCLADPGQDVTLAVRWRLDPQSDGSLTGTRTLTEVAGGTGPCAGSGGVYETPVLLTPASDAPR